MFVGLHAMIGMQANLPELAISEDEGKAFTVAAQNVLRHYSVETTQKTLDWISFAGITAGIYAPRFVAISIRRREERGQAQPRRSADVIRHPSFSGPHVDPQAGAIDHPVIMPDEFSPGDDGAA